MKRLFAFALSVSVLSASAATVDRLVARQMWPWERHFEIGYRLKTASLEAVDVSLRVSAGGESFDIPAEKLLGETKGLTSGDYKLAWDSSLCESPTAEWLKVHTGELAFSVVTARATDIPEYLIIDLSGGAEAASWPAERVVGKQLAGWTDEYKTTKLVLRRIYAGGKGDVFSSATGVNFMFGTPEGDPYKFSDEWKAQKVTLTNDYYIGVFELTQKQYQLITGDSVSSAITQGDAYPQTQLGYCSHIRGSEVGYMWPNSSDVDDSSLMGILRRKVALPPAIPSSWKFDLPTEAQWEFACHAGTTTPWHNGDYDIYTNDSGKTGDRNLDLIGWNPMSGISGGRQVGLLLANAWGLYDMQGNVAECCLDFNTASSGKTDGRKGTEPNGYPNASPSTTSARVVKGGAYNVGWSSLVDTNKPFTGHRCFTHVRTYAGTGASDYRGVRLALRNCAGNAGH